MEQVKHRKKGVWHPVKQFLYHNENVDKLGRIWNSFQDEELHPCRWEQVGIYIRQDSGE